MDDGKADVIKRRQLALRNSAQGCFAELITILFHWLCRRAGLESRNVVGGLYKIMLCNRLSGSKVAISESA